MRSGCVCSYTGASMAPWRMVENIRQVWGTNMPVTAGIGHIYSLLPWTVFNFEFLVWLMSPTMEWKLSFLKISENRDPLNLSVHLSQEWTSVMVKDFFIASIYNCLRCNAVTTSHPFSVRHWEVWLPFLQPAEDSWIHQLSPQQPLLLRTEKDSFSYVMFTFGTHALRSEVIIFM